MRGERYSDVLSSNIKEILKRVSIKKASALIIDGSLGEGKTTLAVNLADEINESHGLPPIKFEEQLALGGQDFIKKIQICYEKRLPVIIYDEAGDYSRRSSMSSFNKALTNTFETFRAYGIVVILCLPYFNTLDNALFKYNAVRLLLHCHDRTNNYGEVNGYGINEMGWLRINMDTFKHREWAAYQKVMPNFRVMFWDITEERSAALDAYCTKGKIKILKKAGVKMNNLVDRVTIAQRLNMSADWVKRKLVELSIKPETRLMSKFYYNKEIIDRLKRCIKIKV